MITINGQKYLNLKECEEKYGTTVKELKTRIAIGDYPEAIKINETYYVPILEEE